MRIRYLNVVIVLFVVLMLTSAGLSQGFQDVVLNEIMYHPYHAQGQPEDISLEYIELYNRTHQTVDLSAWSLNGGVDYRFPEGSVIGGDDYLVIAADEVSFRQNYAADVPVQGGWIGRLSNSGEVLELRNDQGDIVDRVAYADEGDWSVREFGPWDFEHRGWRWSDLSDGQGHSLELVNPSIANEFGQNWRASQIPGGTPGSVNSVYSDDIPPVITELTHHPLIPKADESVTVRARVIDDNITEVSLFYRLDRSAYMEPGQRLPFALETYVQVPMQTEPWDNSVYAGHIPAQSDGEVVEFFVQATDAEGQVRTYPAPAMIDGAIEQIVNALYCVDSSFDEALYRSPGSQPLYFLVLTQAELTELLDIGDDRYSGPLFGSEAMSNAEMNATFISIDGASEEVRYSASLRNRGNRSRANPPIGVRLNLPHDHPWQGKTAVNLNSKYPNLQLMGSLMFQRADLPAARATAIQFRLNGINPALEDGRTYGSYVAVEALDSDWARIHFPNDANGNLYRCTYIYQNNGSGPRIDADLAPREPAGQAPDPNDYRDNYPKRTNAQAENWSDLFDLIGRLNAASSSQSAYMDGIEEVLYKEEWARYFAMDSLLGNREGGLVTGDGDDYAMYRGLEDTRFWLVPHDLDTLLGQSDGGFNPDYSILRYDEVPGLHLLFRHPDFMQPYYSQFVQLSQTVFSQDEFSMLAEAFLGGWVPDSVIFGSRGIIQFVEDRKESVLGGEGSQNSLISTQFSLALPGRNEGWVYTQNSSTTLTGTFNATTTRSMTVNDRLISETDWSQHDGTWRIDYDGLTPGLNRLTFRGFDGPGGLGSEVDRHDVDVWYDTGALHEVTGILGEASVQSAETVVLETRDSYLPGIPVMVRVERHLADGSIDRHNWNAEAVLSVDTPSVTLSETRIPLFNGQGSRMVTFSGSGDIQLSVQIEGMQVTKRLVDLSDEPVQIMSGALSGDAQWSGVVRVTGDLTIGPQQTLFIQPSTLVLLEGAPAGEFGTDIDVQGSLIALGTRGSPVTFTAVDPNRPWGEIHHQPGSWGQYQFVHLTRAGRSPGAGHTNSGPAFRVNGSTALFDHCIVSDLAGKVMQAQDSMLQFFWCTLSRAVMGPEIQGSSLWCEQNWFTQMQGADDNDGIYVHKQHEGQEVMIRDCVFAEMDDDGVDTLGSSVVIQDTIIRNVSDKAVTVNGGSAAVDHCLLVDSRIGISTKDQGQGNPQVSVDFATIAGCQIGIEANDKYGEPNVRVEYWVTNSIIRADIPVRTDYDPNDIHIDYSNISDTWPGTGNSVADPLFINVALHDYRLQSTSPCRLAGLSQGLPVDQGMYEYEPIPFSVGDDTFVWSPEEGPYSIIDNVTVPPGKKLIIQPGTSIFFAQDAMLTVQGQLTAEGTSEQMIRFSRLPGTDTTWNGVQLHNSSQDNRIRYAVMEYASTQEGMVGVENSQLWIDHVTFDHADIRRIRTRDSSLTVSHCQFEDIFGPNEPPTTDNFSEHIWGGGIPEGGQLLIENNVFGTTKGHNDCIDVDGPSRPGPIIEIRNNIFNGGADDALDLEGDAHIEGNLFQHFHKDQFNTASGHSNVISAGAGRHYVVVRNIFEDVDHVAQIKDDAFMTFVNNTVVDSNMAALYFYLEGRGPGYGAYVDGCIFARTPVPLGEIDKSTELEVNRCLMPASWHGLGVDNIEGDPIFVDPERDFHLKAGSSALKSGPWGLDMGGYVPPGAEVDGIPDGISSQRALTISVGGPGITDYQYVLNDPNGEWSPEYSVETPIELTGLVNGNTYTLYVVGKDSAGHWQDKQQATRSASWTVNTTYQQLVINEIQAINESVFEQGGEYPDWIELYYNGMDSLNLSGMSLTDDPTIPNKFTLGPGTVLQPGQYLVLTGSDQPNSGLLQLGFNLDRDGDGVFLFDRDTQLLDSVTFGHQLPDLTIGRVGEIWTLTTPTPGNENQISPLGDYRNVRINEWLAVSQILYADDFIELYNPSSYPVDVGGCFLTDRPMTQPDKSPLTELSFIEGQGYLVLTADSRVDPGHVNFNLSAQGEQIALLDRDLNDIDRILFGPQAMDASQGRSPDGASHLAFFALPNPGNPNPTDSIPTITNIMSIDQIWSFEQSGNPQPDEWKDPGYDDTAWSQGPGVLYVEGSSLPAPKNTSLSLGVTTYYFRTHISIDQPISNTDQFELTTLIDDGAIVYINGIEALRLRMPAGSVDAQTYASDVVGNAVFEGPFVLSPALFQQGNNDIAVEVHQGSAGSSDIVFGAELVMVVDTSDAMTLPAMNLLQGLRLSELMYHSTQGDSRDYVELINILDEPLDISGVRFTDGINFVFSDMVLGPGERTIVASDMQDFRLAYGSTASVAGEYTGKLSNHGEKIVLTLPSPSEAAIIRFSYRDDWYVTTDGHGDVLTLPNPATAPSDYERPEFWQSSPPTPGY